MLTKKPDSHKVYDLHREIVYLFHTFMTLEEFFLKNTDVAVAFSGGTDSSYLLYAAVSYARKVKAYFIKTQFQPQFELEDALRLAKDLHADLQTIELDVLCDETIVSNPQNRCYYCKQKVFSAIRRQAARDGFTILLDGTNASDDVSDRPGMKALEELSVLSPLRICGLTKEEIRRASKAAGLFTWNKPSYACLATRIPAGQPIRAELLQRTEQAERFLESFGFRDFRVRMRGENAIIQITEEQYGLMERNRQDIVRELSRYYGEVLLDLKPREKTCPDSF